MNSGRLLLSESALQTRIFFRTFVAAFFTLVLPLMFLVMINFFIPDEGGTPVVQYVTPALAAFGMVTATFTNLAINTSMARDDGILKRVAGTPLPMATHLGGRVLSAVAVGLLSVALMLLVGWLLFDLTIPWARLPLFTMIIVLGAVTFSALGLAIAAMTPNAKAAPAIANFVILPLAFISGVFFPLDNAPAWLQTLAGWLPLEPLVSSAIAVFQPGSSLDVEWLDLVKLVAWAVIGMVVAVKAFSFEPAGSGRRLRQSQTEIET